MKSPLELVNEELVAFFGEEPQTPLDLAPRETLAGLGCLDHDAPPVAANFGHVAEEDARSATARASSRSFV